MQPSRGTRAANRVAVAMVPLLFLAGVAVAGFANLLGTYTWSPRWGSWLLAYGGVTFLALAVPVVFLACLDRWQVKHGVCDATPTTATRTLNWACGSFAVLLGLATGLLIVLFSFAAWGFARDGMLGASAYFAVVACAMLAETFAFLVFYDRWQKRSLRSR